MIPVFLQPEPANFDTDVRQPGQSWLANNHIALNQAPPKASDLPNYWTHSNKALWDAYGGICAYLAIYFEWSTGASSTEHFIAKSSHAGQAYEWNNYRLVCLGPNRNKNKFDDVLDPIGMATNTFFINFSSGEISVNSALSTQEYKDAKSTIKRLKLDSEENKAMRAEHFTNYLNGDCSLGFLERKSPFVHAEILRQGLD
ncbi:TPA: hypothetical protein I7251_16625 [Vibrio vulnificus]|nr:hypothetical protein [Vibrio vulnificus]HAS6423763.1 hypothetical protein [Vibrio vulnificus]